MKCEAFEKLEQSFVDVRRKRAEHMANGMLTTGVEDQLTRAELSALFALIDHRAEHGCQRPEGSDATVKLPASRNMGGIIGPY